MTGWLESPDKKYGGSLAGRPTQVTKDATATTAVAVVPTPGLAGMTSPKDPMFWFAALAAGTVLLMAYSTGEVG
ncbi:hypothetical protein QE364_003912 [Nocardioides zeae]|uniref:Uncharacterized protein n=1 Tax=Nocardioides zeae TaxID=1457234 RepID=A0ACC6IN55_9ACTN|nr:hypothetical protein [Nocardioides zeae]MDR6212181.1 hypothetical protein [Nocardioides zeae]